MEDDVMNSEEPSKVEQKQCRLEISVRPSTGVGDILLQNTTDALLKCTRDTLNQSATNSLNQSATNALNQSATNSLNQSATNSLNQNTTDDTLPQSTTTDTLPQSTTDILPQSTTDTLPQSTTDTLPQSTTDTLPQNTPDTLPQKTLAPRFQPFLTLSKFIDSIKKKTHSGEIAVPSLVAINSMYSLKQRELSAHIDESPYYFLHQHKFFWQHDISLLKIDGKEALAGSGRFGRVFIGQNRHNELFAIKYFNHSQRKSGEEHDSILHEAALQYILTQRSIVVAPAFEGFGYIPSNAQYYELVLVSRFIGAKPACLKSITLNDVCLEDAARRRNGYPPLLLSHHYLNLLTRIISQLSILAQCRVIHTDIKYDNILLQITEDGQDLQPYLIDFGGSFLKEERKNPLYRFETRKESDKFLRKYRQLAPELIYNPKAISNKSDLYSLALILRGIGNYLEIPALVCVASKLRMKNPDYRPDCVTLCRQIQIAFGQSSCHRTSAANKQLRGFRGSVSLPPSSSSSELVQETSTREATASTPSSTSTPSISSISSSDSSKQAESDEDESAEQAPPARHQPDVSMDNLEQNMIVNPPDSKSMKRMLDMSLTFREVAVELYKMKRTNPRTNQ